MIKFGTRFKRLLIFLIIMAAVVAAVVSAVRVSRQGSKESGLGSEYNLDISSLTHIDPALILYEEISKPIHTGISEARALTVDASGMLYVAGDQAIKVIDSKGRIRKTHELSVEPQCLALTEEYIYIGSHDRVLIIDRNGNEQTVWPDLGDNALITSIALDDAHVYIADAGQKIVWCYDRHGKFIKRIGDKEHQKDAPGFVIYKPHFDLAIAPDGLLWVVNPGKHRLEAYNADGDQEFVWGQFGNKLKDFTSCCNPVNFAILSDGSFVTCEKGIPRVKLYDPSGIFIGVVAGSQQIMGQTWRIGETPDEGKKIILDVAVDDAGHIYILNRYKNNISIFRPKVAYGS